MDVHEGLDMSIRVLRPRWANRIEVDTESEVSPPATRVAAK